MGMSNAALMQVLLVRGGTILRVRGHSEHQQNKYVDLSKGETLVGNDGD
jgi:hypothetical protein